MTEFSGFSFLKLTCPTQIPDKPSQKKISPSRTSRFSFLNAFKKVAQRKPIVRQINNPQKSRISPQNELQTTKSKPVLRPVNAPETLSKPVTNPTITLETPESKFVMTPISEPQISELETSQPLQTSESKPVMQPAYEPQINELQTSQTLQILKSKPVIKPENGSEYTQVPQNSNSGYVAPSVNTSETSQTTDGPKIYPMNVRIEDVPVLSQSYNGCGAAAWAMVMSYFGKWTGNPPQWHPSYDIGLDPYTLREKAAERGMIVRQENNGSLDDLVNLTREGIPVMLLGINGGPRGGEVFSIPDIPSNFSRGHYVVCTGYERDENGNRIYLINDSNYTTTQRWTEEELLIFWNDNIMGGNRYYMAMAPENSDEATQLTDYLRYDRISSTFRNRLETIHAMYDAYYETRGDLVEIFTDLSDFAENVQNTFEDAIDWFFG